MNILFIYPAKRTTKAYVPIGIAYLGTILNKEGHNVNVIDLRYDAEEKIFLELKKKEYGAVCFQASTEVALESCDILKRIKNENPNIAAIVGGPHATIDPNFFLDRDFDVAVIGEGEATIAELVDFIEKGKDLKEVKGILWKANEREISKKEISGVDKLYQQRKKVNPPRPFIEDLDKLPIPDYGIFPHIKETMVHNFNWTNIHPHTHILVSRGCPYRCNFCQPTVANMFGNKIRKLSPSRIVEWLQYLKDDFKVKEVLFEDELLLNKGWRSWFYETADLMRKNKIDIRWGCQARSNSADEEMLIKAKKAGCYLVMVGVESGAQEVLDFYQKGITVDDTRNLFSLLRKHRLYSVAEIIFGAPNETWQHAMDTVRLVREIKPDGVWISILTPYPGTTLYDWLIENKVAFEKDVEKIDRTLQQKRIDSKLSIDEIYKLRIKAGVSMPSLKYAITRQYYRKLVYNVISNRLSRKEYKNLLTFSIRLSSNWILNRTIFNKNRENVGIYRKMIDYFIK